MMQIFILIIGLFFAAPTVQNRSSITIEVTGFEEQKGQVIANIYRSKDGFPTKPEKAWRKVSQKVQDGKVVVIIEGLPPGEYAIALHHDANSNGKVDTNWLGLPNEGMAVSNNAKGRFGPPSYEDAKFTIGSSDIKMQLKLVYL